jgi:hypothetical protein
MKILTDSLKINKTLKSLNIRFRNFENFYESEKSFEYLVDFLKENYTIQELFYNKQISKKYLFQIEDFLDRNRRKKVHFGIFSTKLFNIQFKF